MRRRAWKNWWLIRIRCWYRSGSHLSSTRTRIRSVYRRKLWRWQRRSRDARTRFRCHLRSSWNRYRVLCWRELWIRQRNRKATCWAINHQSLISSRVFCWIHIQPGCLCMLLRCLNENFLYSTNYQQSYHRSWLRWSRLARSDLRPRTRRKLRSRTKTHRTWRTYPRQESFKPGLVWSWNTFWRRCLCMRSRSFVRFVLSITRIQQSIQLWLYQWVLIRFDLWSWPRRYLWCWINNITSFSRETSSESSVAITKAFIARDTR